MCHVAITHNNSSCCSFAARRELEYRQNATVHCSSSNSSSRWKYPGGLQRRSCKNNELFSDFDAVCSRNTCNVLLMRCGPTFHLIWADRQLLASPRDGICGHRSASHRQNPMSNCFEGPSKSACTLHTAEVHTHCLPISPGLAAAKPNKLSWVIKQSTEKLLLFKDAYHAAYPLSRKILLPPCSWPPPPCSLPHQSL